MELNFYKYHGTGNDFIMIWDGSQPISLSTSQIRALCDRRFGIGADGLIIISDDSESNFRMRYYNSDGNESTLCGNGGRCAVAFADFLSQEKRTKYHFKASDGFHDAFIIQQDENECIISLHMNDVKKITPMPAGIFLNTGSPHLVRFHSDIDSIDIRVEGRKWRFDNTFDPGGTNVNFVEKHPDFLKIRSYERGVEDETLSCGTGVTASVLALASQTALEEGKIDVQTRGGMLVVSFKRKAESFTDIWLTGPATRVYSGKINIELFEY